MRAKGMLHANKGLTVFVASGAGNNGGNCPRAVLNKSIARFRDDYYGSIKVPRVLSKTLFR